MRVIIEISENPNIGELVEAFFDATDFTGLMCTRNECKRKDGKCEDYDWVADCDFTKNEVEEVK